MVEHEQQEFDFLTSRSQYLSGLSCPRLRLLESHTGPQGLGSTGVGWVPRAASVPLAKGGSIHLGLQRLLEGASADEAVQDMLAEYDLLCKERGFLGVRQEDQGYTYHEQRALCEVALRVWALRRLPYFKQTYEFLEIEREAPVVELAPGIGFQSRRDGLLRNRASGFLEILSFKTASVWRHDQDQQNENDVQGISEAWTVKQGYGEDAASVLMEYLVLGPRKKQKPAADPEDAWDDEGSFAVEGPKLQDSFLVRPWRVGDGKYAWRGKFRDAEGTTITAARVFDPNYGLKGKARTEALARNGAWEAEKVPVWEQMSPKAWVEMLAAGQVWPYGTEGFDPLARVLVSRSYTRQAYELEEWRREAAWQESRVREGVRMLTAEPYARQQAEVSPQEILDSYFPRNRKNCHNHFGNTCAFYNTCWKGERVELSDRYKVREPNHPVTGEGEE